MSGWKDWQIGEVVTEGDFQSLVQDQVVQRYADSAARTSALGTAVAEGMVSYLDSTNSLTVYDGSSWIPVGEGDITSVTAGTGLSGGGTAGDVTLSADYAAIGSAITIETSQVSDLTATAAELNILDGATVTAAALNTIDDGTAGGAAYSIGSGGVAFSAPGTAGQVLTSTGTAVEFADVASGGGGLNYIINGAMDVWQRGTSFTGASQHAADRFVTFSDSGGTVSQQTFTPAEVVAAGFGDARFYLRVNRSAGGDLATFHQKIEDVRTLAGQTITASFWAKASTAQTVYIRPQQIFGSGGSAAVVLTAQTVEVTTSWQRFDATFELPSISGKTIGTNSHVFFELFWLTSAAMSVDIWGVQLEAGSVATPFRRNANSLQGELAACQRYYWQVTDSNAFKPMPIVTVESATSAFCIVQHPVQMRANPTFASSGSWAVNAGGTTSSVSGFTANEQGVQRSMFNLTVSGLTAGRAGRFYADNDASAFFSFSSEL